MTDLSTDLDPSLDPSLDLAAEFDAALAAVEAAAYRKGRIAGRAEVRDLLAFGAATGSAESAAVLKALAHFDESKHPRDHGKFASRPNAPAVADLEDDPGADKRALDALAAAAPTQDDRDAIETAAWNVPGAARDHAPQDRRVRTVERLAAAWRDTPGEYVLAAIVHFGGALHGPPPGETVPFDGRYHESDGPAFTGDAVTVVRQPVVLAVEHPAGPGRRARAGEHVALRGKVTPVATRKALPADDDDADDTDLYVPAEDDDAEPEAHSLLAAALQHAERCHADGRDAQPVLDALYELGADDGLLAAVLGGDEVYAKAAPGHTPEEFLAAAIDVTELARRAGDDPAEYLAALHARAGGTFQKSPPRHWDESKHSRDHGKFSHTAGAKGKAPKAPTAKQQAKHAAKQEREKAKQAKEGARAEAQKLTAELVGYQNQGKKLPPEKVRALIPHLTHLADKDLTALRQALAASGANFGGGRIKADRVAALVGWAKGEVFKKRRGKADSVLQAVVDHGGIDPNSHAFKTHYSSIAHAREDGIPLAAFKRGGGGLDALAQELHNSGLVTVPEGADQGEHVLNLLKRGGKTNAASLEKDFDAAYEEYARGLGEGEGKFDPNAVLSWDDEQPEGVFWKALRWDESKHPRARNGRFISRDRIEAAKTDPKLRKELRKEVKPEDKKKLEDALSGKADIGKTAKTAAKHAAEAKRAKVTADREAMKAIRSRLSSQAIKGKLEADDLHAMIPHLSTMSGRELSAFRELLQNQGVSFGGEKRVDERRERLLRWAKAKALESRMDEHGFSDEEKASALAALEATSSAPPEDAPPPDPLDGATIDTTERLPLPGPAKNPEPPPDREPSLDELEGGPKPAGQERSRRKRDQFSPAEGERFAGVPVTDKGPKKESPAQTAGIGTDAKPVRGAKKDRIASAVTAAKAAGVEVDPSGYAVLRKFMGAKNAAKVPAMFLDSTGKVHINERSEYWSDPSVAEKQHAAGWWATGDSDGIIHHEVAHALQHRAGVLESMLNMQFTPGQQELLSGKVSKYAMTHPKEFVAEVYSGLQTGKQYDADVMRFYQGFGGPPAPTPESVGAAAPPATPPRRGGREANPTEGERFAGDKPKPVGGVTPPIAEPTPPATGTEHPRDRLGRLRAAVPNAANGFSPLKGEAVAALGNEAAPGVYSVVGVSRDGATYTIRPDRAGLTADQKQRLRKEPGAYDRKVSAGEVIPTTHAGIARRLTGIVGDADTNPLGANLVLDAVEQDLSNAYPARPAVAPTPAPAKPADRTPREGIPPDEIQWTAAAFAAHAKDAAAGVPGRADVALSVMNTFRGKASVAELRQFADAVGVDSRGTRDAIGQRLVAHALRGAPSPRRGGREANPTDAEFAAASGEKGPAAASAPTYPPLTRRGDGKTLQPSPASPAVAAVPDADKAALVAAVVASPMSKNGDLAHFHEVRDKLGWDESRFAHAIVAAWRGGLIRAHSNEGGGGLSQAEIDSELMERDAPGDREHVSIASPTAAGRALLAKKSPD